MTAWRVTPGDIDERPHDFTAHFTCTNGETGNSVQVTITQKRGTLASDMVGALLASGELLRQANDGELDATIN